MYIENSNGPSIDRYGTHIVSAVSDTHVLQFTACMLVSILKKYSNNSTIAVVNLPFCSLL